MNLARVCGRLIASHKDPNLQGVKLLLIQPLNAEKEPVGQPQIATDATGQAGEGELVLYVGGREAAIALENGFNPSDCSIIGIVDAAEVH